VRLAWDSTFNHWQEHGRVPDGIDVLTLEPEHPSTDWDPAALADRRWDVKGTIVGHSDSHGLVYEVRHHDGTGETGWYEPRELVLNNRSYCPCALVARYKADFICTECGIDKATTAQFMALARVPNHPRRDDIYRVMKRLMKAGWSPPPKEPKTRRAGSTETVKDAKKTQGFILNGFGHPATFRVYEMVEGRRTFTDYRIAHSDLEVEIIGEAAFYEKEDKDPILDHSPTVLGEPA
jgi:hypothetical protein